MSRVRSVAIWTGADPVSWSPRDIERSGLGGTETAAVRVAEELSRLGYEVVVLGNVEECAHRGVAYSVAGDARADSESREATLWMRLPADREELSLPERSIAWTHQRDLGEDLSESDAARLDAVLAVSEWHRRLILGRHPGLEPRTIVVGNGVERELFAPPSRGRNRARRVLFTSQPERGLDILLEIWPQVRQRVTGAELAWCYAPVYDVIADRRWVAEHRRRIDDLAAQPGTLALGPLAKPELARLMGESSVWAHPSWATPFEAFFDETSCISAMEAQATGMCVVASRWGALSETVRVGELVEPEGAPGEPWRSRLLEGIVAGLLDDPVRERAAVEGPAAMASCGWDAVAARIAAVIEGGT